MNTPQKLVRLNLHLRSDHLHRLTILARALGARKRRDTRLAEAMELLLTAGLAWDDADLLDLAPADKDALHWLQLGHVDRFGGKAISPDSLRGAQ